MNVNLRSTSELGARPIRPSSNRCCFKSCRSSFTWPDLCNTVALEILEIADTEVSYTGLAALAGHQALNDLDIGGNDQIDDAAIDALLGIPNLRGVTVIGTGISKEVLSRLRDAGIWVLADDHHQ